MCTIDFNKCNYGYVLHYYVVGGVIDHSLGGALNILLIDGVKGAVRYMQY